MCADLRTSDRPSFGVLIIDDQYATVRQIEELLRQLGVEAQVNWASTLYESRIFLTDWKPDLILLDVHIQPGDIETDIDSYDGDAGRGYSFDFLQQLVEDFSLDEVVIAILSADYNANLVSMAEDVGVTAYIQKQTLSADELNELIQQATPDD